MTDVVYLLDAMERAAKGPGTITFLGPAGDECLTWGDLYADALRAAGRLRERGGGPGLPVAVLGLNSRATVTAAAGVWLAGSSLTVLPTPARTMDVTAFVAATARHLDRLAKPPVLVGPPYDDLIPALVAAGHRVVPVGWVLDIAPTNRWHHPALADDDPAILQLTSGTTSAPRIVRVTHANLAANLQGIAEAIDHGVRHGRTLSWLPLSHDMGLIGILAAMLTCGECDLLLASPTDYLANPATWLQLAARHRVQTIVGPTSAYALAARLLPHGPRLDLSTITNAMSGGEPIDPDAIEAFLAAAAPHGLDPRSFQPAYGLAEATVAVTTPVPMTGLRVDEIDAGALARDGVAAPARPGRPVRRLPLLGRPLAHTAVRIVDPASRHPLPDRGVGEVEVSGPAVTRGYHGAAAPDGPVVDGWLRTGDLGYLVDGELVICGRLKDLIIIGGRNVFPEDIERAAGQAPGVRPGNAVAFPVPRGGGLGEGIAVAVESRTADPDAVRRGVTDQVRGAVGMQPVAVYVLPPGSIPKTPSGKLQRAEAARRFAS